MLKTFTLKYPRFDNPAGTTVYLARMHDYGCARDDTNATGEQHVSVTLQSNGDYPFFTVPESHLQEVREVVVTGSPPGLLQDDSKQLSKWLANTPGARKQVDDNSTSPEVCREAPQGWYCNRAAGHEGSCAATLGPSEPMAGPYVSVAQVERAFPAQPVKGVQVDAMRQHIEDFAKRGGWEAESGEGAFEFVQRTSYAQGAADAAKAAKLTALREIEARIISSASKWELLAHLHAEIELQWATDAKYKAEKREFEVWGGKLVRKD